MEVQYGSGGSYFTDTDRAAPRSAALPAGLPTCHVLLRIHGVREDEAAVAFAVDDHRLAGKQLGEETAVDFVCADLDRAARQLLDLDPWLLCTRIEAALTTAESGSDRMRRDVAKALSPEFRTMLPRRSFEAARNLLDELLDSAVAQH